MKPRPPKRKTPVATRPKKVAAHGGGARPTRTRRSAEEARTRILEAAERELLRVGPEGLRLTDLARTLRISHPAILHHFGSREGLVAAVVRRATHTLTADLIAALSQGRDSPERLMDMAAEVCDRRGFARLSAWLVLSGRSDVLPPDPSLPLRRLAEAAHALRARQDPAASFDDTLFELQLAAVALLGEAIFGEAVRRAAGLEDMPEASHDFRRRLARLLLR